MISQAERTWFICVRFDDFTSWTDMIHQSEIRWFHRLKGHGKTDMIHLSEIWWFHKLNGHAKTDTIRLSNIWLFHTLNGHGKTDMIHLSEIWWFHKLNGHDSPVWDLMISQAERTWFTYLRFDDFTSWTDMGKRKRFICRIWWFRKLNGHVKTNIIHLTEIWWFPKLSSATRPRVVS